MKALCLRQQLNTAVATLAAAPAVVAAPSVTDPRASDGPDASDSAICIAYEIRQRDEVSAALSVGNH